MSARILSVAPEVVVDEGTSLTDDGFIRRYIVKLPQHVEPFKVGVECFTRAVRYVEGPKDAKLQLRARWAALREYANS